MKQQITVEILPATRVLAVSRLPSELRETIVKMPPAERETKSVLWIDGFPPKLMDNKAISRYFPMFVGRTFQDAIALLRDCDNLYMIKGDLRVTWSKVNGVFLDGRGNDWSPSPDVILSDKEEWYVYSEVKSDSSKAEFPSLQRPLV